jgi:predicted small lipoprotein YifL
LSEPREELAVRLLTATLLSLMLTACGQSGALYFAKPENAKPEKEAAATQQSAADAPAEGTDKDSTENSDATTGP